MDTNNKLLLFAFGVATGISFYSVLKTLTEFKSGNWGKSNEHEKETLSKLGSGKSVNHPTNKLLEVLEQEYTLPKGKRISGFILSLTDPYLRLAFENHPTNGA